MNTEFIKNGKEITTKQNGEDYILEAGRVYNLKFKTFKGPVLEMDGVLNLPNKLYTTEDENKFINRIVKYFNERCESNLGVLLTGLKGSGKTLMSKQLAVKVNLPIIVVDPQFDAKNLNDFFLKFNQPVVILFDEVEKNSYYWDPDDLLPFLDGVQKSGKRLVIMTCNDDSNLSNYMKDRCGRIRYIRKFKGISNDMIKTIVYDFVENTNEYKDKLTDYIINNVSVCSFDNIISFCNEIVIENYPKDFNEVIKYMNITTK
ncbi:non-ATPase regulatory subunit [uncultured phage cr130_1]|uniref:Non-ATPase regulatory subunit n=1 Tax=uncultured phage cr130_1 TaxID=2772092 RepID=A0A7M1RUW6_9CAUD|nr:ATPase [uncultured phage cr130_1]QOR57622.1 non-ATPase regulatory subunit [uncultured phage cr130_1]